MRKLNNANLISNGFGVVLYGGAEKIDKDIFNFFISIYKTLIIFLILRNVKKQ